MRSRFLTPSYELELYRMFMDSSQGKNSVNNYTEEFYQLGARVNRLSSVVQIERNSTSVASMIPIMDFNWKEPRLSSFILFGL